jgi:Arc/MetJ-type ribon-helix-helix transcriptional regulator
MTGGAGMPAKRIAVSIDKDLLARLDQLVQKHRFPSRSRAVQEAIREKLGRLDRRRLARECAKLEPQIEQALAEEGFAADMQEWPEY